MWSIISPLCHVHGQRIVSVLTFRTILWLSFPQSILSSGKGPLSAPSPRSVLINLSIHSSTFRYQIGSRDSSNTDTHLQLHWPCAGCRPSMLLLPGQYVCNYRLPYGDSHTHIHRASDGLHGSPVPRWRQAQGAPNRDQGHLDYATQRSHMSSQPGGSSEPAQTECV